MPRLLVIDNCMDCKHMKLIGNMNIEKDIYEDIYYCCYDKPLILFKFNENQKRTPDDFKIPNDKCKLEKYNDNEE
jgi:hypothetical protein